MVHDPGASGPTERRISAHCRGGIRAGGRDRHLTIKKIPQYEVANDSSGYTLIIGEEYYNAQ